MLLSALMNIPPPPDSLCLQRLPDELIAEVLSWLPVKTLIGLRCVSKIWNALTSDASFIKLHRQRSAAQNPQILFKWDNIYPRNRYLTWLPVSGLVENSLTTLPDEPHYLFMDRGLMSNCLVGSCNGLICIHFHSFNIGFKEDWLYFWNPAISFLSKKLGYFRANYQFSKFTFGYDNSNDTYKVLFFDLGNGQRKIGKDSQGTPVKVFTLGDNIWRNIQSLPVDVVPLHDGFQKPANGVNLSGTLNWVALHNSPTIFYSPMVFTVENFLILSLDLGTETYTQFSMPKGFDEVPCVEPSVGDLMNCLCFCHDWKKTHFVIWQMKVFGVENSWTQLLKISYQDLQIQLPGYIHQLFPLFLYNGHTLILVYSDDDDDDDDDRAILFNMRDNTTKETRITNKICWSSAVNYVETLVSPY